MSDKNLPEVSTPPPQNTSGPQQPAPSYYTPGYARRKFLMIVYGCLLVAVGISQMWTPGKLLFFGARATAEATRVIKAKSGVPEMILINDAEIRAKQETQDRSSTFWNEFRFQDAGGREIVVRAPVGSQLKPLYPLIDEDGLPTTLPVHYNPSHPEIVSFPSIFSTWFAPGLLVFVGLGAMLIGSVLFYWANKPIELPHLDS